MGVVGLKETALRGNDANKKARFEKKRDAMAVDDDANTDLAFGAIQVCRNYIRSYNHSWASLRKHGFLESLYKSGVGFDVFAGCSVIDLVLFPLRLGKDKYLPFLVSVKPHVYFSPKAAKKECDRMLDAVEASEKSEESNSGEKAPNHKKPNTSSTHLVCRNLSRAMWYLMYCTFKTTTSLASRRLSLS